MARRGAQRESVPGGWAVVLAALAMVLASPAGAAEPVVLRGHLADVFMAAFTPDGGRVVTASADETVRLWDAANGAELRRFTGHTGPVSCLAVSGDGRTLVTGGQDNAVRVWGLPLPGPRLAVAAHATAGTGLVVLPDGRTAVTAGGTSVRVWQLESLAAAAPPPPVERVGHSSDVVVAAATADGSLFATADASGRILVWSPLLDEPLGGLGLHLGGIDALAFLPDNQRLVSAGHDGTLRSWALPPRPPRIAAATASAVRDLLPLANQPLAIVLHEDAVRIVDTQSLQAVREFPKPTVAATALAVSGDATIVALADAEGGVRLHQVADAAERGRVSGHVGPVHDVAFLTDNASFVTAGADGTVRRWAVPAAAIPLPGHVGAVHAVASAPDGAWLVSAGDDKTVRVWNPAGQPLRTIGTHAAAVQAVAIAPDAQTLFTGDAAGTLALWGATDGAARGGLAAHRGGVRSIACDRSAVWSAGADGTLKRWRLPLAAPLALAGHTQPIRAAAAPADGSLIVTGGQDQTVRIWDATTGQAVRALGQPVGPIATVAISTDGSLVAAVTDAGLLRIWKTADGTAVLERMLVGGGIDVAFLAAPHVATIGSDNMIRLWDVAAPADAPPTAEVPAADADTRLLATDPAGTTLVASGGGRRLVVWRVAAGRIADAAPVTLGVGPARVTDLAFASEGHLLAAACEDGRIAIWETPQLATTDAAPRRTMLHTAPVRGITIDAGGTRVAVAADDGVTTYDMATAKEAERPLPPVAQSVVVAAAGGRFASGGPDGAGRIWTPALDRLVPTGDAPTEAVSGLAVLPDDGGVVTLAAGSPGLRRFGVDGGVLPPLWPDFHPTRLAAAADGSRLAAADAAGTLRTWPPIEGNAEPLTVGPGVTALALTRDAAQVVVADALPRLRAFGVADGRLVESVPLAAPATTLAITGTDGRLWAAFGPQPAGSLVPRTWLATWETGGAAAHAVATAADGSRLFAGLADGGILQIATATGAVERTLTAGPAAIHDVALETTSGILAAGGEDGIHFWSLADGTHQRRVATTAPVRRVVFGAAASKRLASADATGLVEIWDTATGAPLEASALHAGAPAVVRYAADGQTLLSAGRDGRLAVWKEHATAALQAATVPLRAVVVGGGNQVIVADDDGTVRVLDLASGGLVRTLAEDLAPPLVLAMRPDGQRLAIGDHDGGVQVVNPANAAVVESLSAGAAVTALAWRADGQRLAAGTQAAGDTPARIVGFGPPAAALPGRELEQHDVATAAADVVRLAYDRDGRDVWSTHADGRLARWTLAGVAPLLKLDHGGAVLAVTISRDGQTIVSGGADNSVRVWDATTGQQRAQMGGHTAAVHALAFTPDEALVVSAAADRTLRLWDVGGGRLLKQVATTDETVYAVAVHPAGQTVAAGGADRAVHLVNLVSGAVERTLAGHGDYVHAVAYNPAGTTLLSYGYAGELRIWGLAAATPVFDGRVGRIGNSAAFDPRGERIVVANGDRTASIIEVPAGAR